MTIKSYYWPLMLIIFGCVPVAQANQDGDMEQDNPCIESGSFVPCTWECGSQGSISDASLEGDTEFEICIGENISPPSATATLSPGAKKCDNGINSLICPASPNFGEDPNKPTEEVGYTLSAIRWEPELPSTFDNAGEYTFTAYVKGISSDSVCADTEEIVAGTITVTVNELPGDPPNGLDWGQHDAVAGKDSIEEKARTECDTLMGQVESVSSFTVKLDCGCDNGETVGVSASTGFEVLEYWYSDQIVEFNNPNVQGIKDAEKEHYDAYKTLRDDMVFVAEGFSVSYSDITSCEQAKTDAVQELIDIFAAYSAAQAALDAPNGPHQQLAESIYCSGRVDGIPCPFDCD